MVDWPAVLTDWGFVGVAAGILATVGGTAYHLGCWRTRVTMSVDNLQKQVDALEKRFEKDPETAKPFTTDAARKAAVINVRKALGEVKRK